MIDIGIYYDYFLPTDTSVYMAQLDRALPCSSGRVSVGSNPILGSFFWIYLSICNDEVSVDSSRVTGSKFTKGIFNPKPKLWKKGGGLQSVYLQIFSNTKNSQFLSYWPFWVQIFILSWFYLSMSFDRFPFSMFDKICNFLNYKVQCPPLSGLGLTKPILKCKPVTLLLSTETLLL